MVGGRWLQYRFINLMITSSRALVVNSHWLWKSLRCLPSFSHNLRFRFDTCVSVQYPSTAKKPRRPSKKSPATRPITFSPEIQRQLDEAWAKSAKRQGNSKFSIASYVVSKDSREGPCKLTVILILYFWSVMVWAAFVGSYRRGYESIKGYEVDARFFRYWREKVWV